MQCWVHIHSVMHVLLPPPSLFPSSPPLPPYPPLLLLPLSLPIPFPLSPLPTPSSFLSPFPTPPHPPSCSLSPLNPHPSPPFLLSLTPSPSLPLPLSPPHLLSSLLLYSLCSVPTLLMIRRMLDSSSWQWLSCSVTIDDRCTRKELLRSGMSLQIEHKIHWAREAE